MDSKEIRQRDPVARTSWSSMEGIGEQIYELTLQVREIAARMAEQAESTPAPEAASAAHPSDAVTRDVVMQALDACWPKQIVPFDDWQTKGMTAALRTFAEAYQVTRFRIEQSLPLHVQRHDPEYSVRVHDLTMHALLPEVKP